MAYQKCPVCEGRGIVPTGFYNPGVSMTTSGGTALETCRTCGGTGVIAEPIEVIDFGR
jgi:DnaJ-class molecular chaperone